MTHAARVSAVAAGFLIGLPALAPGGARATLICLPGTAKRAYCTDVPPVAATAPASQIGSTRVTLNGAAGPGIPNGDRTSSFFEWGLTGRYGTLTESRIIPAGPAIVPVSAVLRGLIPCTRYRYALVATNPDDTTIGLGKSVRTGFLAPLRSVRLRHRSLPSRRLTVGLALIVAAPVRAFLLRGRRTLQAFTFGTLPAGRSAVSVRAPRRPGHYRLQVVARLACGHQAFTEKLFVRPGRAAV